jgi:hypothetical protein
MLRPRVVIWSTGVIGGALFAVHASFPRVDSWPMIWPALTGAVAFWLVTRNVGPHPLRSGLAAALGAGIIAGGIAFVATTICMVGLIHTAVHSTIAQSGVPTGFVTAAGVMGLAALAVVVVIVAVLGAIVLLPIRHVQLRHAHH